MEIDGPIKIGVLETPDRQGWELHLDFRPEFRALSLQDQAAGFRVYLQELAAGVATLDEADRNRQGMLLVQQIAEQLWPHVEAGDLDLSETIVVEIAQAPIASLQDLIDSHRI